jgi:hypothetical protein
LLVHGRWFSPGTPASSTTKTGRHDITEILLKVAVGTIKQTNKHIFGRPISDQPTQYSRDRTHVVLVIGLYEWLGNPTIFEPPGPFGNMNPYMATTGILLDITVSQINNKIK